MRVPDEMNDGRPLFVDFIFTDCPAICPLSGQAFAQFQSELGADRSKVHLVSITIDPEQDTPGRLTAYARKFHAQPGWDHYTGTSEASLSMQRAFGVSWGGKMDHAPVVFVRQAPGLAWERLDGFWTAADLLAEYRNFAPAK